MRPSTPIAHSTALALLLLCGCQHLRLDRPVLPRDGDWPTLGRTEGRTGALPTEAIFPLEAAWEYDLSAGMAGGGVLVTDSIIFAGTMRGELHAIRLADGKRLGTVSLGEAIHGAPVILGSTIYLPLSNSDAGIRSYDLTTGRTGWSLGCGEIEGSLLRIGGGIYGGTLRGEFLSVNATTGERRWSFPLPGNSRWKGIRSSPAAWGDLVLFGADDGVLYALDTLTGTIRWKRTLDTPLTASPVVHREMVVIGSTGGGVHAIEPQTGRLIWSAEAGGGISGHPFVDDSVVIVGTHRGSVVSFARQSGKELWRTDAGGPILAGPVGFGDAIIAGTMRREAVAIRRTDGTVVWRQGVEGRVKTPPVVAGGMLFIATDDRTLWAFRGRREN